MNKLLLNHIAQLATPVGNSLRKGRLMREIRVLEDAAVYMENGIIAWVGKADAFPSSLRDSECRVLNAAGCCAVPGFVDSHTHFLFGGYRAEEFIQRLQGKGYLEILKAGGGIQATVQATRAAGTEELMASGLTRLKRMLSQGVTTVEGKSGYGLDRETELRQLEVLRQLDQSQPVSVVPTYLGGHAVPPEWANDPNGYLTYMLEQVMPVIRERNLAEYCDIFCEDSVFSLEQSAFYLKKAKSMGFGLKIHADEIVALGGAGLAASLGAVSADHLLMTAEADRKKLAEPESRTVASLLPATAFCLKKPYANARAWIDDGCAVALASDYNPGSCFAYSIPLLFALAVIHMDMTVEEALCAMTLNGAAALDRADRIGSIEVGKQADVNLLAYPDYRFLVYHTATNSVKTVIKRGEIVYENETA